MIEHIPRELQTLPQWVAAGENKVPINPRTGDNASPTDSSTWGTFGEAKQAGLKHIGFMLAATDPYTIIDLDDPFQRKDKSRIQLGDPDHAEAIARVQRHAKFLELFDSYTEISQSGQGMHIVVRGRIPKGVRRDKVEIYSAERYMIFTGNVFRDVAIADRQELLDVAFREMDTTADSDLIQIDGSLDDLQVVEMAMRAANAEKFNALCRGEWETMRNEEGNALYESQSEADLALMTIFAYYTRDNEQVRRLFRMSALGKREKAERDDYLNYALQKIRGKQPPLVDISAIQRSVTPESVNEAPSHAQQPAPVYNGEPQTTAPSIPAPAGITFPPGLVGDIARFGMTYAVRPVPEIALAAAIALTAGICGRSYNVSNTGLNQYIFVLARTGSGKEAIAQIVDALISEIRKQVPAADQFVGPAEFGSGQGMLRALEDTPCFVSVLGEFGTTLQQVSSPKANTAEKATLKVLLDLYGKSGWHQTRRSTVYSDKTKNSKLIQAPNATLIGESNPEAFYDSLSADQVSSGLIPRFLGFEYTGPRPKRNSAPFTTPSESLLVRLRDLASIAISTHQNAQCAPVQMDSEARKLLNAFDVYIDEQMNNSTEAEVQIWNRAHLKALKLAGVVAVGVNPHVATVTSDVAQWAIDIVTADVHRLLRKFRSGDVGQGHSKQYAVIGELMQEYLRLSPEKRRNYKAPATTVEFQIVPLAFLTTRVRRIRAFNQSANMSPRRYLENVLNEMVDEEVITRIPLDQAIAQYKTRMPLYLTGPQWSALYPNK